MPPFFSQLPMGWISEESTRRQKSFLLSLPSSRKRRREPVRPTTVAMQVDVVFLGSWASSFMPALNSFTGGVVLYREGISHFFNPRFQSTEYGNGNGCKIYNWRIQNNTRVNEKAHLSEAVSRCRDCSRLFQVLLPAEMPLKIQANVWALDGPSNFTLLP